MRLCNPMDYTAHGILQLRVLEWVAVPSPGNLPNPGIEPGSPTLQAHSLKSEPPGRPCDFWYLLTVFLQKDHFGLYSWKPYMRSSVYFQFRTCQNLKQSFHHHYTSFYLSFSSGHSFQSIGKKGASLVVQLWGPCASNAGGAGSIPGRGTKFPHALRHSQIK